MPENAQQLFQRIQSLLLSDPANHRVQISAAVTELHRQYLEILEGAGKHAEAIKSLEEKLKQVDAPPLIHAVLIGPSHRANGSFVVAVRGERRDVDLAPTLDNPPRPEELLPGDEVLVHEKSSVIISRVGLGRRGDVAEVRDVLENPETGKPDRLLVHHGGSSDGIVVELSAELQKMTEASVDDKAKLRAGDRVTIDPLSRIAFEKLPSHETGELQLEKDPKARYEDVAGLEAQIQLIKDMIEMPYLERRQFHRYGLKRPHGILLHGPPGCGKTMIGAAAANGLRQSIAAQLHEWAEKLEKSRTVSESEARTILASAPPELEIDAGDPVGSLQRLRALQRNVHSYFFNIKGPELLSKWVGEAESRVRQIFAEAKRKASYTCPVIVFFDEIESMFQRRGSGVSSDMEKTMVPQILAEMDGVIELENVIIIGASNRHELLDPALLRPGRLDMKIRIDRPDRAAASAIFRIHICPSGSREQSLPLSREGLGEEADAAFEGEMRAVLERLSREGGFLVFEGGAETELISLDRAFTPEQGSSVVSKVQDFAGARGRQDPEGRRVRFTDISHALEDTWRAGNPRDTRRVQVVLALDRAGQSVADGRLPILPLSAGGQTDRLVDWLIDLATDTLFSPRSYLKARVLASCGREYNFLLSEFVSGALIANVVTRAKRAALKREVASGGVSGGVTAGDLLAAIKDEYTENKDQFVANKPEIADSLCDTCKRRHNRAEEFEIEVLLGRSSRDRWGRPRNRPYERGRGAASRNDARGAGQ